MFQRRYSVVFAVILLAIGAKATTLISFAEGGKGEALPTGAIASLGTSHFLHRGPIRDLEFFPDGSRLLSVAGDQVVAWDVTAARKGRAWKLDSPIRAGAVSSDGRRVAVADSGRLLHIFDASTGQRLSQLAGLAGGANRVAFTPDGQRVIGGTQGEVLLWNAEDGEILRRWTVDGETIKTLQISPDGKRFVIAVGDLPMRIHRIEGDDPPVELEGGPGFRAWAAFSPDGKTIAGSCEVPFERGHRSSLRLWDSVTGRVTRNVPGSYRAGTFSPDGRRLAACDLRSVVIYDAVTGEQLQRLPDCNEHLWAVAFSPDGKQLAVGQTQRIRLWNTDLWTEVHRTRGHSERVQAVAFSPDGRSIVTGGLDGQVVRWAWPEERELMRIKGVGSHWGVQQLTYSPDARILAATAWINWNDTFFLFDAETGSPISRFGKDDQGRSPVAFSPDGKIALTGQMDGTIALWDAASGEKIRAVGEHRGRIVAVRPLPDFQTAWWAGERQRIGLRDLTTGEDLHVLEGPWALFRGGLVPSPDGQWLAVGSRVVDAKTGEEIAKGSDTPVAISPDGRLLAYGNDEEIVVWESLTRQEIHKFDAGQVDAIAFSPDGTVLASAGYGETLIWDMTGCLEKGRLPLLKLSPEQLEAHWETLGGEDGWAARLSVWTLAAAGESAVAFLSDRLRPAGIPAPAKIHGLRQRLADPEFDVRELAARELLDLGIELRPEDREALYRPDPPLVADPPFPNRFNFRYSTPPRPRTPRPLLPLPDRLRSSRAVAALELSGLPDAETLLNCLADGAPQAPLTREAIGSLARVRERK